MCADSSLPVPATALACPAWSPVWPLAHGHLVKIDYYDSFDHEDFDFVVTVYGDEEEQQRPVDGTCARRRTWHTIALETSVTSATSAT